MGADRLPTGLYRRSWTVADTGTVRSQVVHVRNRQRVTEVLAPGHGGQWMRLDAFGGTFAPLTDREHALWRACCSFEGGADRWAAMALAGASDDEVLARCGYEFGLGGGSSGPGQIAESNRGGADPCVWFGSVAHGKCREALRGAALVREVRALFGIGPAADAAQPDLFSANAPHMIGRSAKEIAHVAA